MQETFVLLNDGKVFRRTENSTVGTIDEPMTKIDGLDSAWKLDWRKNGNITVISPEKMDKAPEGYRFSDTVPPYETKLISKDGQTKVWSHLIVPDRNQKSAEIDAILNGGDNGSDF